MRHGLVLGDPSCWISLLSFPPAGELSGGGEGAATRGVRGPVNARAARAAHRLSAPPHLPPRRHIGPAALASGGAAAWLREGDRLLGGGSGENGDGGGGKSNGEQRGEGEGGGRDGRVEDGVLVAVDAPALLTAQPLPAAAPERAVYGDSTAMLHGRYSALSLCKLLVIHMPRDLMSVQNTPTRSFHVHRPQATHDHDGLLRFGAEGAEESTLNEALLAAVGAGEHAGGSSGAARGEEGVGWVGEEAASEMTMPRGSELAEALRDRSVVDQALMERAMELSVFGSKLNLRPRRPTDTSPHHHAQLHYSHVHAHYHSHYNLHATRVSPAPSPASALFTASQPHLLPGFGCQAGQPVNRAATSSGASARKSSDPNIVQSMRSGQVSTAGQGQLARGGAHSTSLSAILPSLYAAAGSRTPGSDGVKGDGVSRDGGAAGDVAKPESLPYCLHPSIRGHQHCRLFAERNLLDRVDAMASKAAFVLLALLAASAFCNASRPLPADSDNSVTVAAKDTDNIVAAVPADNDNTVAVVPAGSDNSVAVVPADNDNTVAVVPVDNDNTVAVVPADNDNTVAVVPADNGNTVAVVPADNDNTVAVVPADNDNTVTVVPADNDNTVAVVPADNDNTVAVVPADNDNTVAVVPADNDNTVAVVPADNDNTVAVVPADNDNTVAVVPADNDNTVAVVPADNDNTVAVVPADNDNTVAVVPAKVAEDNVAVAQPSSDVSPKIAMGRGGCEGEVTKASVAAVETAACNAGGLTKRSVAESNGNAAKQFTMDEVSKHNRPGNAWVVVQNKVYDVSNFADQHPGGRVIYLMAGRNATDVFAVFHKPSTSTFLSTLYIGDLKDSEVEPTGDLLKDFRDLRASFEAKGYFKCSPAYYLFKVLSTFAIVAASIAIIMWTSDPRWVLVSAVLLGLFFQQVGWLSHDFLHHQVSATRTRICRLTDAVVSARYRGRESS
ncbi:unnamed protein product [Closterium sp. NIES-65]|nr:unnamed protein product [Closterium sp. NIES-65]